MAVTAARTPAPIEAIIAEPDSYPPSRWDGIDMRRFRDLRAVKGGRKRAAHFFRENVGRIIHRSILEALLHDQRDYMKRIRLNGGSRDDLTKEGIEVLSGTFDIKKAALAGYTIEKDDWLAISNKRSQDT